MTYTAEQIELRDYIAAKNEGYRKEMAENPNLWIGITVEDPEHWAQYGIYTVEQYEFYMEYEGCYDWLAGLTNKGYARYVLQECKTVADIEAVFEEHKYLQEEAA